MKGGSAPGRVGRWADGLLVPGTPDSVRQAYSIAEESWRTEGRAGTPRLVGAAYYALGPDAWDPGAAYIRDYYAFMSPANEYMVQGMLTAPQAIKDTIEGFSSIGMDELILWPTTPDLDQVHRLAEVVG